MKYREVVSELKAAGASWIQFDEPTLVKDLDAHELAAFSMSIHVCSVIVLKLSIHGVLALSVGPFGRVGTKHVLKRN